MKRNEKPMKERILEEALQLFSQNGYTGTSMNDIAAKLGVTKAALYKHYKSKQEILDSIVEKASEYGLPEEQQGEDFLSERQVFLLMISRHRRRNNFLIGPAKNSQVVSGEC